MVSNASGSPSVPDRAGAAHRTGSTGDLLPLLGIALAALLWAIAAAAAGRLFEEGVDPIALVAARAVLTAIGLSVVPPAWRAPKKPAPITYVALGVAIALVNATYYLAIDRLAVAVAIVLQYTGPAMVVAWTALRQRCWPERRVAVAVVAAFIGVALISELTGGATGDVDLLGFAFGIGAAVMFAAYTLQSERTQRHYGTVGALRRAFAVAAGFWIGVHVWRGFPGELVEPSNLPLVLFVGIGGTLMPFLLYIWGVKRIRSERAVIVATLEPLFAGLLAWWWLGQTLSALQVAGGLLILAAIVMLELGDRTASTSLPPAG